MRKKFVAPTTARSFVFALAIAVSLALTLAGCASMNKMGIGPDAKSFEPDYPASGYSIGQIVEINSMQGKVSVIYTPSVPADSDREGTDLSSDKIKSISTKLGARIEEIINENLAQAGTERVIVSVSGVRTQTIPKFTIYRHLQESFRKNPELMAMTKSYSEMGTKFNVITRVTTADISFSVIEANGKESPIDPDVLRVVNSRLNAEFRQAKDKKSCAGEDMILSFEADPKMIASIVSAKK